MSRIKSDKINLGSSIVVDFFSEEANDGEQLVEQAAELQKYEQKINAMEREAELKREKILNAAKAEAQSIEENANLAAQKIRNDAQIALEEAKVQAQRLIDEAQAKASELLDSAAAEAVQIKETASQEGAKQGYEAGYSDGTAKIQEELAQKIQTMDEIAQSSYDIKNKILNSSKREIVELVLMIAKKVCINSIDKNALVTVVNNSIALLDDKENIELILSEKYAALLSEVFSGNLSVEDKSSQEIDIDKLKNIKLIYNSKTPDDTLIVQTPKERLDLSFESQLSQITKSFLHRLNSLESENVEDSEIG